VCRPSRELRPPNKLVTIVRTAIGISVLLAIISSGAFAERRDPPNEAPAAQIAKVLRQARLIGVFCGDDVDQQTCKFFANALRVALKDQHVNVSLFYQPETLVQSFYVPPMLIPFTDVTVRLIEAQSGPQGAVQVFVGGFCFDPNSTDLSGFQLPRWVQTESTRDTGPLEADKANAAGKLAQEFSAYWIDTVKGTAKEKVSSSVLTESQKSSIP
jgi:hypothetical protein